MGNIIREKRSIHESNYCQSLRRHGRSPVPAPSQRVAPRLVRSIEAVLQSRSNSPPPALYKSIANVRVMLVGPIPSGFRRGMFHEPTLTGTGSLPEFHRLRPDSRACASGGVSNPWKVNEFVGGVQAMPMRNCS